MQAADRLGRGLSRWWLRRPARSLRAPRQHGGNHQATECAQLAGLRPIATTSFTFAENAQLLRGDDLPALPHHRQQMCRAMASLIPIHTNCNRPCWCWRQPLASNGQTATVPIVEKRLKAPEGPCGWLVWSSARDRGYRLAPFRFCPGQDAALLPDTNTRSREPFAAPRRRRSITG